MTSPAKAARIEELMQKAQSSLKATKWFEAERLAQRALEMAHSAGDFGRMRKIVLPLQEARRQRMQLAATLKGVRVKQLSEPLEEDHKVAPGLHMLQPPLVGADARRVRLSALQREVPALILCREPTTQLGLIPIVAIGLLTVRARIDPPDKLNAPSKEWFLWALEQVGDAAIGMIDTGMDAVRQVDTAMCLLDAIPEHEQLHTTLGSLCEQAEMEMRDSAPKDDGLGTSTPARQGSKG
ncbi:MAG: hypothetical protein EXS03_05645 [Phycisphaerales bacterium]|nr:hypothetical protein [Phycisphaerales bacterium]